MNTTLCSSRLSSGLDPKTPTLVHTSQPTNIPPFHILLRIDRFGFSANNVTYQSLGEHPHFRYFEFHEVPQSGRVSAKTHGLVPVWGFATVEKSAHPAIQAGERVYGYFAPARYLLLPVSETDVTKYAFYVPRPHLPQDRRPYNQIIRCSADSQYSPDPLDEDLTMLYRPLFWTSYWLEDHLFSSKYRNGATRILISSASSKTAFCLAYCIQQRISQGDISPQTKVVGLTSHRNLAFTQGLGLYNEVLDYDTFASSQSLWGGMEERWIYVDVSGSSQLNDRIFAHFASPYTPRLVSGISLGMTTLSPTSQRGSDPSSWSQNTFSLGTSTDTSSFWPAMEPFFMPEWLDIRRRQLSLKDIVSMQGKAWGALMKNCRDWVTVERVHGGESVLRSYKAIVNGGVGPEKGLIWSLWDEKRLAASRL